MKVPVTCLRILRSGKTLFKLSEVIFLDRDATDPFVVLDCLAKQWAAYGTTWYDQCDVIFDTENYLLNFFRIGERVASADREVLSLRTGQKSKVSLTLKLVLVRGSAVFNAG